MDYPFFSLGLIFHRQIIIIGKKKMPASKKGKLFMEQAPIPKWPGGVNPHTGERGGPGGLEPTRYGDWERKGRLSDF